MRGGDPLSPRRERPCRGGCGSILSADPLQVDELVVPVVVVVGELRGEGAAGLLVEQALGAVTLLRRRLDDEESSAAGPDLLLQEVRVVVVLPLLRQGDVHQLHRHVHLVGLEGARSRHEGADRLAVPCLDGADARHRGPRARPSRRISRTSSAYESPAARAARGKPASGDMSGLGFTSRTSSSPASFSRKSTRAYPATRKMRAHRRAISVRRASFSGGAGAGQTGAISA